MMKPVSLFFATCLAAVAMSCSAAPASRSDPLPQTTTVPMKTEDIFGRRQVIQVRLNGQRYSMMIHSSAKFFMQIPHAFAAKIGAKSGQHVPGFGIQSPGSTSKLGRDEGSVERLEIGRYTAKDVPASIFETPGPQDVGMLGLGWIRANRVVLDFPKSRATLNPTSDVSTGLRAKLLAEGYVAIPMQRDPVDERYKVRVRLEKEERLMTVSTVAHLNIDEQFAKAAKVEKGHVAGRYGGPKGSQGLDYETRDPVTLTIGQWTSHPIKNAQIQDIYAYSGDKRPADNALGGQLGADVLIENGAVIDFGTETLYLRK